MPFVCLIGRHGSGKSTIGSAMRRFGFAHFSVGTLRRLARHNQFPSDVPYTLMVRLRRLPAGEPLPISLAQDLVRHCTVLQNCVLDGFPASVDHLSILPPDTVIGLVYAPQTLCVKRLTDRAAQTLRQWTSGRESAREIALASVLRLARRRYRTVLIRNVNDEDEPSRIAHQFLARIESSVSGQRQIRANFGADSEPVCRERHRQSATTTERVIRSDEKDQ